MNDDLINEESFDCFFTENDMLRQHCRLLETELAELHGELRDSRGKIATLVLMWSGVSRELAIAELELKETKWALEIAREQTAEKVETVVPRQAGDQVAAGAYALVREDCHRQGDE